MYTLSNIWGKLKKLNYYFYKVGIIDGVKNIIAILNFSNNDLIRLSIPELKYPIKLRAKTTDLNILKHIFLYDEYNISLGFKPKLIIDGGAYVGFSSVFFANRFPEAKIIAIEPEESNFKLLKENTSNYQNIELINGGIWNKAVYLRVKDGGKGHYGFSVAEVADTEEYSVKAITIGEILRHSGYNEIDILKLDIEGSEKEVFSANYEEWLGKTNVLIIELHDRYKSGCSEALYSAIEKYNFDKYVRGENIFLVRHDINKCH